MIAAPGAVVAMRAWEWPATGSIWRLHHSGGVDAVTAGFVAEEVECDEARWSRFRPGSDVSRINAAGGAPVAADSETLDLLEEAALWTAATGGVFQPLVGGALEAWGYRRSLGEAPAGAAVTPGSHVDAGEIVIDRDAGTVAIPAGARLDLGGIAKGFMARRVARFLAGACVDPAVILDAGGDLVAVRGDHAVAVEDPADPRADPLERVLVRAGQAVATSGYGRRRWRNDDGVEAHHLIDPATGRPGPRAHVSVIAADVVEADVVATTVALRPGLASRLAPVCAIDVDGVRTTSPAWCEAVVA
jgi:thiamine biosynthesis lipoprotein